jgi:hypothetical protein
MREGSRPVRMKEIPMKSEIGNRLIREARRALPWLRREGMAAIAVLTLVHPPPLLAAPPTIEQLLPADSTIADVMDVVGSQRFLELSKRVQVAAAKNRDWWVEQVQKTPPGEPIPYDPRIGLTEVEYREYLRSAQDMTLAKVGTSVVRVARVGSRVLLRFEDELPGMEQLLLDLEANTATTPFGVARDVGRIEASEEQRVTGPWNGIQWKLEDSGDPTQGSTLVKLALGALVQSGRGLLYYDARQISPSSKVDHRHILIYDLRPTK